MTMAMESPEQDHVLIKVEPYDGNLDPMQDPLALDLPIPSKTANIPEDCIEYVKDDQIKSEPIQDSLKSEPCDPSDPLLDYQISATATTAKNEEEQGHGYGYIADVDIDYDLKLFSDHEVNPDPDPTPGISTDVPKPVAEKGDKEDNDICSICGKNVNDLHTHGEKEKDYKCHLCDNRYARTCQLKQHIAKEHGNGNDKSKQVKLKQPKPKIGKTLQFVCELEHCGKVFMKKDKLKQHQLIHTKEKNFECEICHKLFKAKKYLQNHMTTHSKERNYLCSVCGKKFKHNHHLENHMTTHTGEKSCLCPWCNMKYSTIGNLRTHIGKYHSGPGKQIPKSGPPRKGNYVKIVLGKTKPLDSSTKSEFQCDICQKFFKTKKNLQSHNRQFHSKDTHFVCDICPKSFKAQRYLQRHKNETHSEVRNYSCSVCGKKFKQRSQLKSHVLIHTREEISKCPYCDNSKEFVTASNMRGHIKRCHLVIGEAQTKRDNKSGIEDDKMAKSERSAGAGADPLLK